MYVTILYDDYQYLFTTYNKLPINLPGFIAFINEVIYVLKRGDSKFGQVLYIGS